MECERQSVHRSEIELVAIPVSDLSNKSLKKHWKSHLIKRMIKDVERLRDIDKQFFLYTLSTVRRYGMADIV